MHRRLGEILVFEQVITEKQLEWALDRQGKLGAPLGRILISNKLCSRLQVLRGLGVQVSEAAWSAWPGLLLQICLIATYNLFGRSRPPQPLSKQALIDLRQAMEAAASLSGVCDAIHGYACRHLLADGSVLQLQEGNLLKAAGARGSAWGLDWNERLDGPGLSAHCFRSGLPVSSNELDPGVAQAPEFGMMGGPAAAITLPLFHRGTLKGVLTVLAKPKSHLAPLSTQEVTLLGVTVGGELQRRNSAQSLETTLGPASVSATGSPALRF